MFSIFVVQWIILKCFVEHVAGVQFCLTKWFLLNRYKRAQRSLISNTQKKAFVKYCNASFYINSPILQFKLRKSCVLLLLLLFFFHLLHETCPYSEFSGSYYHAFGPNTEIYSVLLRIQSKCGKIRTRKTPSEYGHFLRSDPKISFFYQRRVKDPVKRSS